MPSITEKEVLAAIEKVLELPAGTLNEQSKSEEFDRWDSLGQLGILVALDKLFEGKISSIGEMAEANSVDKILGILRSHSLL